ncbi:MAG: hypothetical protein JNK05_03305 [Myxococcales bacterium]|nr:hypothetical protein [Myxococcales bacterium]
MAPNTIIVRANRPVLGSTPPATVAFDYHPACAIDVDVEWTRTCLRASTLEFAERAALEKLADHRIAAKTAANLGPRARAKFGAVEPVEPARDPTGRPRVRVLLTGNNASTDARQYPGDETFSVDEELRELVRDGTIASPLREYVFVEHFSSAALKIDPSQPLVGGVVMMHTSVAPAYAYRAKLADWLALGLPPPILCVISNADRATTDAYTVKLRAMVEQTGYAADACPVLVSEARNSALFRAISLALDEHTASSSTSTADPGSRAAEQLARAVERGELDVILVSLQRAAKAARRARVADKQSMARSAQRCLLQEKSRRPAIELLEKCDVELDCASVLDAMRALLVPRSRPLNADFGALAELLVWHDDHGAALDAFLLEALLDTKPDSKRAEAIAALLGRSFRSTTAAALRAASERAKPPLASLLSAAATEVERRSATIEG